jgi:DNA processing protein
MKAIPWLRLSMTTGLGPILIRRIIEQAGSPEAAAEITRRDLQRVEGIGSSKAHTIWNSLQASAAEAEAQLEKARSANAAVICPDDELYPDLLRPLQDAPTILFVHGTFEPRDLNSLAIVGSRRCTHYGREQAERFGALLAGAGFTVVSGGARGIDSAGHRGALQHPHGRTIAVLGSGLDVPYPSENTSLFKQIAERGAVVTELPFGTPPNAENFPRRNRIVSGLSRGVFVIEADERSGALITARLANEDHGRPVFALPGRVDNPMAAGSHKLIRDGAVLVTKLEEIIDAIGPLRDSLAAPDPTPDSPLSPPSPPAESRKLAASVALSDRQELILDQLGNDSAAVEQLIERTGLPAPAVLQELTFLSLKGVVKRIEGQTYARSAKT